MAAPALEIVRVPVLSDNYAWLVFDPLTQEVAAVDPGEAEPVLAAAAARGWTVSQVWTTHWHPDHTGGNASMKAAGATITGPRAERDRIPTLDTLVAEGDVVRIGSHTGHVLAVPGHTAGHLAFHFAEDKALFTGDTLFAMGCGRLFEGTAAEMWANMERYAAMPDDTRVYCGHEYTAGNAAFAVTVEPDNDAIATRRAEVDRLRAAGEATVPTSIGQERATNPFMRAGSAEALARLREAKDNFRG
ncbi:MULTISPECIES: hydroxyacylglutathione hydrolase [unclassified Sphingomonas]|uniref:hydroxyacylglutathione hydrolase n=1 Tax=unclassified Sphingomonas TaxID=196159 RepID=UPI0028632D35|nr:MULTISPECIES: hydroxyacylglutathione hydrolase [unclassified Sphingomonas]MDR6126139.1 hydroxyacylglutathione hydrolase [Sphingomonas sp. SORGH_AS_0438]